jgi:transcription elongation factor GreA
MASDPSPDIMAPTRLGQAVSVYLTALPPAERDTQGSALNRFVRWLGPERELAAIIPIELERYQEQLGEIGVDPTRSLEGVRAFLTEARRRRWTDTNLGVHIKVRKRSTAARGGGTGVETRVEMTQAGLEALQRELERLEGLRPQLTDDLQRAAADKDFRENAPYDAAKQRLAEVQTRINGLRAQIGAAAIVEGGNTERAGLGTKVIVRDLEEDEELSYTLVGPGEIDARRGRISIQSPVGRALSDHIVGDTVPVNTPAGTVHYRIERIEPAD